MAIIEVNTSLLTELSYKYYICAIMPYNKKNGGRKQETGRSFDKKKSSEKPRNSSDRNERNGFDKKKDFNKPTDRKPFKNHDKDELAPPRFLPPPPGKRPYSSGSGGQFKDKKPGAFDGRKRDDRNPER